MIGRFRTLRSPINLPQEWRHMRCTPMRAAIRASANGIFSEWEKNVYIRSGETKTITLHLIYAKQMPKSVATSKSK
jgi:hypothetical protein